MVRLLLEFQFQIFNIGMNLSDLNVQKIYPFFPAKPQGPAGGPNLVARKMV